MTKQKICPRTVAFSLSLVWIAIGSLPTLAEQEPQTVDLQPKFMSGRQSRYEIWSKREISSVMSGPGGSNETSMSMTVEGQITWVVQNLHGDGTATCLMTLDWAAATLIHPDGSEHVNDSRRSEGDTPVLHTLLRAMAGVPIRLEVAEDGRVEKVSGTDAIRDELSDPEKMPEGIEFIESASDLALLVAGPAAAVQGETWNDQFSWQREWGGPIRGMLHHDMKYSLNSVEDIAGIPVATVSGAADLSLEVDRSDLHEDGPSIDIRLLDGSASTQIMIDLQRGEVVGRNAVEFTRLRMTSRIGDVSFSSTTDQTIQSQALRIAEEAAP